VGDGVGEPACEGCGFTPDHMPGRRSRIAMMPMEPGPDGREWFLCSRCYVPAHVSKTLEPKAARKPKKK